MSDSTFLTRVTLTNYKSIAHCDVQMRPLMFLVGPNGAGKSNFLDALRFVSDALNTSLDHAIRKRGGFEQVSCQTSGDNYFIVRLEFLLPTGETGCYGFEILQVEANQYNVLSEECRVHLGGVTDKEAYFYVENRNVTTSEPVVPVASDDRLYLVAASGLPPFRPVYDALTRMAFYNLNPEKLRDLQQTDWGTLLTHDGDNITSVLQTLMGYAPNIKQRIEEYLAVIVPGITGVNVEDYGPKEMLEFKQQVEGGYKTSNFPASSMSDGTLRALGILVALFQTGGERNVLIPLVGIEEPETALHPAAVAVLLDALEEASLTRQVLITSHSADLLDNKRIDPDALLAVAARDGKTEIGPIDAASRSVLRDHLFTAGEMLRMSQFAPDTNAQSSETADRSPLPDEHAA